MDRKMNFKFNPDKFVENKIFREILNNSIQNYCDKSRTIVQRAYELKSGWINIVDNRSKYLERRTPPEDIFGSFLLEDGIIQKNTFFPMPTHRLLTSDGIFRLDSEIEECMIRDLEKIKKGSSWLQFNS